MTQKSEAATLTDEQMAALVHDSQMLRKTLKRLGKNQLIQLVFQQMNLAIEQQNINKVLLEDLKKMNGEKNETSS
jgi:hypothetical protein